MDYTYSDIAKMIDHSLLNPVLTDRELEQGCWLAIEYDVASVCILPYYLRRCVEILEGSTVKAEHDDRLPAWRARDRDQGRGGPAGPRRRRAGTGHGRQHQQGSQRRLGVCPSGTGRGDRADARARAEGQGDLRELLPQYRPEDPALRDLRATWGRLGEDLHRLRHRRRHDRGSQANAGALARRMCRSRRPAAFATSTDCWKCGPSASRASVQPGRSRCSRNASDDLGCRRRTRGQFVQFAGTWSAEIGVRVTPSCCSSKLQTLTMPLSSCTSQTL